MTASRHHTQDLYALGDRPRGVTGQEGRRPVPKRHGSENGSTHEWRQAAGHGGTWATYATPGTADRAFSKALGVRIPPETPREQSSSTQGRDPEQDRSVRGGLRGPSAIAADCGAMFFAHNEGNITQTIVSTKKLFVLAGIDKVVPTWAEGMHIAATYSYT